MYSVHEHQVWPSVLCASVCTMNLKRNVQLKKIVIARRWNFERVYLPHFCHWNIHFDWFMNIVAHIEYKLIFIHRNIIEIFLSLETRSHGCIWFVGLGHWYLVLLQLNRRKALIPDPIDSPINWTKMSALNSTGTNGAVQCLNRTLLTFFLFRLFV